MDLSKSRTKQQKVNDLSGREFFKGKRLEGGRNTLEGECRLNYRRLPTRDLKVALITL
jgi:hypothetical protein